MEAVMAVYKGFNSYKFESNKQFGETDIELVKTDLINHIFTKKGTRVMMPTFGTIVPDLIFEPLDEITTDMLEEELRTVFDYDPRVELLEFDMRVDADRNAITLAASLFYVELNLTDVLNLDIPFN